MTAPMIPARPTTYRGIPMRSRLEASFAAVLDASAYPWTYEPRAYANELGQYLPDFLIETSEGPLFVEVRPTIERGFLAFERMQIIWDSEPTAKLLLFVTSDGETGVAFTATAGDRKWRMM